MPAVVRVHHDGRRAVAGPSQDGQSFLCVRLPAARCLQPAEPRPHVDDAQQGEHRRDVAVHRLRPQRGVHAVQAVKFEVAQLLDTVCLPRLNANRWTFGYRTRPLAAHLPGRVPRRADAQSLARSRYRTSDD